MSVDTNNYSKLSNVIYNLQTINYTIVNNVENQEIIKLNKIK